MLWLHPMTTSLGLKFHLLEPVQAVCKHSSLINNKFHVKCGAQSWNTRQSKEWTNLKKTSLSFSRISVSKLAGQQSHTQLEFKIRETKCMWGNCLYLDTVTVIQVLRLRHGCGEEFLEQRQSRVGKAIWLSWGVPRTKAERQSRVGNSI